MQCFWKRHTGKGIVEFAVKIVVASWLKILKVYPITKRTGLAYNTSLFSANVDRLPFFSFALFTFRNALNMWQISQKHHTEFQNLLIPDPNKAHLV